MDIRRSRNVLFGGGIVVVVSAALLLTANRSHLPSPRMETPDDVPTFESLVGKLVLVGLTRVDGSGQQTEQTQYNGRIVQASTSGIVVETSDGKRETLPPTLAAYQKAPPGDDRESSSGTAIVNPDLVTMWAVRESAEGKGEPQWTFTRLQFPKG